MSKQSVNPSGNNLGVGCVQVVRQLLPSPLRGADYLAQLSQVLRQNPNFPPLLLSLSQEALTMAVQPAALSGDAIGLQTCLKRFYQEETQYILPLSSKGNVEKGDAQKGNDAEE